MKVGDFYYLDYSNYKIASLKAKDVTSSFCKKVTANPSNSFIAGVYIPQLNRSFLAFDNGEVQVLGDKNGQKIETVLTLEHVVNSLFLHQHTLSIFVCSNKGIV